MRAATRIDSEPLRILTCPTHERYETGLCKTNAIFYALRGDAVKDWDATYAPVPSNYILLNPKRDRLQIPEEVEFDLVLSQNKAGQFPILKQLAQELHLPLVSLEHTLPVEDWPQSQLDAYKSRRGDINIFISEFSRERWGWGWADDEAEVIHHGVDTKLFSPAHLIVPKKNHALSVVNDWINRDWCCGFNIWREVVQDDLPVMVVGNTPGLSKPAKNVQELVWKYREADVFINTSTVSPIPSALLEAMSCGVPIVSTATAMIPSIIQHGVNGLISNDPAELRAYVIELLGNKDLRVELGNAARQTVIEKFSTEVFVEKWNDVFRRAANIIHKG